MPIDAIYSSDLIRARQTAEAFRQKHPDTPYREDQRLRERYFGDAVGRKIADFDADDLWGTNPATKIPNIESIAEFSARVTGFIDDLKAAGYQSVLVVCHGGTINRFLDIVGDQAKHTEPQNASVTSIAID